MGEFMYDSSEPFDGPEEGTPLSESHHSYPTQEEMETIKNLFPDGVEAKICHSMFMGGNIPSGRGPVGITEWIVDHMNRRLQEAKVPLAIHGQPQNLPFEARNLFWKRLF